MKVFSSDRSSHDTEETAVAKTYDTPLDIIRHECRIEGNLLFLPTRKLACYAEIKKILTHATGKWNTSKQAFVFERDPKPILDEVCATGKTVKVKKNLQAFYTPETLAHEMVKVANIQAGMTVLEPSAGEGAIAEQIVKAGGRVVCVESDAHAADIIRAKGWKVYEQDFLSFELKELGLPVDAVLMNPPFTKEQWAKHLFHAWDFVRPGGVLVCIAPPFAHQSTKTVGEVNRLIRDYKGTVTDIPAGTFKQSGTSIATCMIRLCKI